MTDYPMSIGGDLISAPELFGVVNPATGEVFANAPNCTLDQLDLAMSVALDASSSWRKDEHARRKAMHKAAESLEASGLALARLLTSEQGKPLAHSIAEINYACVWMRYYADLDVPREVIQDDMTSYAEVFRKPLGVVASIVPWNVPILLAIWHIAPALRAGNTVVLKPSPYTPLATLKMGELLLDALPPGVLNVISGTDPLGAKITAHEVPRKISFTGSIVTGKKVARSAARDLKRITLELGGNDPAIVLEDADPERIADEIFGSAFALSGQVCNAVKRVYVHQRVHDEMVEVLAERARKVRTGDGHDERSELGPINNRPQLARVSELVQSALARGAIAAAGGHLMDRPGYFFAPTILAGVNDGIGIVDEEQFGPALPVVSYRDINDAVARANSGYYGLSASVWSADSGRAAEVALELDCGQVNVNTHGSAQPHLPFAGHKWSGIGVMNGPWGLNEYTDIQVLSRPAT